MDSMINVINKVIETSEVERKGTHGGMFERLLASYCKWCILSLTDCYEICP